MTPAPHVAITEAHFRRLLELLALSIDLVEMLLTEDLRAAAFTGDRVARIQQAVMDVRAEAAAMALKPITVHLTDGRDWCPSSIVH